MLIGACVVLYPNITKLNIGDVLILIAALIAPLGNFFQQRARKTVSSESILFIRSLISAIVIFFLAYIFKENFSYVDFKGSFFFLFINGIFLFGLSKLFWIEGIHRISVTKSNALSSVSSFLTLLFAWIFLQNMPTIWQLLSLVPMGLGVILLSINREKNIKISK
jgi:drug/metabolite transporter (DMT)-like permease